MLRFFFFSCGFDIHLTVQPSMERNTLINNSGMVFGQVTQVLLIKLLLCLR